MNPNRSRTDGTDGTINWKKVGMFIAGVVVVVAAVVLGK